MEVTLIRDPRYILNFAKFLPEGKKDVHLRTDQRVYRVAVAVIQFFGVVISSTFQAGYLTLRYAISSFGRLVLDSFRITDFYFGAFKIAYWVFSLGFTFLATATRLVIDAYSSSNELFLAHFASSGLDLRHIQTKGIQLDSSEVPDTVKVAGLLTLLDQINFTQVDAPGYMPPTTRQEDKTIYSVEDLRASLGKFIENVDGRVAFLGTPPAHDNVRLNAFYQQIEDAVRLSLHKVTQDLETFNRLHPDPSSEGEEVIRQHKNLLEDQARLVLDLAIAGKHCGARYMGEAMSSYFGLYGETEPSGTLEDTLIELLAAKRNEVAQGEIQRHFGASTHGFSQYMQHMGGLLAIPGTENVIEHLSGTFDYTLYLRSFFSVYTEDFIIDAIQEKIRKSQPFREQIIDWLKEQVGTEWLPTDLPDQVDVIRRVNEIIREPVDEADPVDEIQFLVELLELRSRDVHSVGKVVSFPDLSEGWSDFIAQLFALDEVKANFKERNKGLGLMVLMRKRQALIQRLSSGPLGQALESQYSETGEIVLGPLNELLSQLEIAKRMKAILPVETETLLRVLRGEAALDEVVKGYLQGPLQSKFLYALNIEEMERDGLSPVMMEWLLDAHSVFVPKDLEMVKHEGLEIEQTRAASFRGVIDPEGNVHQMQTGRQDLVQEALIPMLKDEFDSSGGKRYIFGAETDIQEVCLRIFEEAFNKRTDEVILAAEALFPGNGPLYPRWKEVVYIKTPEIGAAIFGNPILKTVVSAFIIFKLVKLTREAYEQSGIWANQIHRYLTKEVPPQVTEAYRNAHKLHRWIEENKWRIFIYGYMAQYVLSKIPHPLAKRAAKVVSPGVFLGSGGSYLGILWSVVLNPITFGWKTSSKISSTLEYTAERSKQERESTYKKHCYTLWNRVIEVR
ncbi:MAG: hypothetical protein KFB93_06890 [Simkaniaceae bacterium]|nr:MAG: hypothetical protein KFB93_06890 [Simkaniaceae bacterium]